MPASLPSATQKTRPPLWVTGLRELPAILVLNTAIGFASTFMYDDAKNWDDNLILSQCIGLCIYVSVLFMRVHRARSRIMTALMTGMCVVVGVLAGDTLAGWLLPSHPALFLDRLDSKHFVAYVVFGIAGGTIGMLYFGGKWRLTEEKERAAQAQRAATEADLRALQAQVEPHFLFNTLANLDALIALDPKQARALLAHLNRYLRSSLTHARSTSPSLQAEVEQLRAYLAIMETRLPDRFHATIDCPEECLALPLAPMLIQPLVENAIKHGIEPSAHGGEIVLRARLTDDALEIEVCDSGVGLHNAPAQASNNGTGIANVRERLRLLYGEQARLTLTALPERGTLALLSVPRQALQRPSA
jgi:signal transduction histidine kinase